MMKKYFLILSFCVSVTTVFAQIDPQSALYKTILSKDSALFTVGFNTCDIKQFEDLLSEQFEFFHDQDSMYNKKVFIAKLRSGLCKSPSTYQSRRELIAESSEVYPLYKNEILYGAIQTGIHRFYETTGNAPERFASTARFTNIWLLEKGQWKLGKSLSYDHQETDVVIDTAPIFDNDEAIEQWLSENNVPTLGIGVIREGKLQQVKVFGERSKGATAPYNTIFNVASLTKPVTAMVTLKLVSLGKWKLDEPIWKFFTDPDVSNDPRSKLLTTRHVLSHQTGFPNWRRNSVSKKLAFEFDPGTKYQYSGEGYEYLRKALEQKFHKTLDQLAEELLFVPLHMNDTHYCWDDQMDSSRFATGYDSKGNPYETKKRTTANAADDLLTTIEDYGNFLVSVMNAEGLSPDVYKDMITHQVQLKKDEYVGLGFIIYDLGNGQYALSHGGSDKGAQTIAFILPQTKQGLLIFTNVDDGYKVFGKLMTHYLGGYGKQIFEIETHK